MENYLKDVWSRDRKDIQNGVDALSFINFRYGTFLLDFVVKLT